MNFGAVSRIRLRPLLALLLTGCLVPWSSATAEITTDEVIRGIQGYICSTDYWRKPTPSHAGRSMPLGVGRQGSWAVAWLDDSEYLPKSLEFSPDRVRDFFPQHSYFFALGRKFGEAVVLQVTRYAPGDQRPNEIYEDHKPKPFLGSVERAEFVEPQECPSRLADSLTKQRIRTAIVEAVRKQLSSFNKLHLEPKYRKNLRVFVQSFTIHDHFIEIYVPQTREVFSVALHHFQNPEDDQEYVRDQDFPFGQRYRPSRNEISLIQRDGTVHEIQLND